MTITNAAIGHRVTIVVFIAMLAVLGTRSYTTLPRESAPDITIPIILVTTFYEGAAPSDMETLITKPLERKLKELKNVRTMKSDSAEGTSTIELEFEPDEDIDIALQRVREKVNQAKPDLPADLEDDPVLQEISFSEFPIMNIIISGAVGLERLKKVGEDLEEDIEGVPGVLGVDLVGAREPEIRIEFDQDRLTAYSMSVAEMLESVRRNNLNIPSGSVEIGEARFALKVPGELRTPRDVSQLVLAVRDGKPIYLSDIAIARYTYKDRQTFARHDHQECVTLLVKKRSGENLIAIADRVKELVLDYEARFADTLRFSILNDHSKHIRVMVNDLESNILSGMLLVLIVIFSALGFRNALLVALAIPLAMLTAFAVLQGMNVTLNMVVLFSLILALGMLVDNAIVVVENIYRHHAMGKPLVRAAMEGTDEIAWPIISSTATTVAAFAPLLLWPGIMGEFMTYLPLTVIIVLTSSLGVALVITPTLSSIFVRVRGMPKGGTPNRAIDAAEPPPHYGPVLRTYQGVLNLALRFRVLTVLVFVVLLIFTVHYYMGHNLGMELFPDTEPAIIMVKIETPMGTRLEHTNRFALIAEEVIAGYGNVRGHTTTVGQGGAHKAELYIDLVDREERRDEGEDGKIYFSDSNDTMSSLRRDLREAIVGANVVVDKPVEGPPREKPVNVEISGDDYDVLARLARALRDDIKDIPGLADLDHDYVSGLPEFRVDVDRERAAMLGLNVFMIGQMLKAAVGGMKVGSYRDGEDEHDITVRLPESDRQNIQDVLRLHIPDMTGRPIPLSSVARVSLSGGLGAIRRIDQTRVVTVSADLEPGYNAQAVLAQVRAVAEEMTLPQGYYFSYTGENQDMEESQEFLSWAFMMAIFCIMLILVTQFNSIGTPFIILTTVMLSLIGVFLSLIITQRPFGIIMTGLGVISLAGVVVNNAIVLIDYTNQLHKRGLPMRQAIIQAGCTRFRPVLLTAITTILGLTPMAVGISFDFRGLQWQVGGESSQWWGPMATAVIFGLGIATFLTLVLVPSLLSLMHDWRPGAHAPDPKIPVDGHDGRG